MKKKDQNTQFAFAWYKPEQWALLRAYSVDGDDLEDSFIEWSQHAEQKYKEFEQSGMNMHKVVIDVDALIAWCKTEGLPLDGAARSSYAATILQELDN